MEMEKLTTETE